LYVEFKGEDISGDFRSFSPQETTETADVTAGNDTAESHVVLRESGTVSYTAVFNSGAGTAVAAALANMSEGTLIWGPEGTASGARKYSRAATVTSHSKTIDYGSEQTFDVEFTFNGGWILNYDRDGYTW
jgi:hypothetical protein